MLRDQQRHQGQELAVNGRNAKPAPSPGPAPEPPKACNECPKCPCKGNVCNCTAETEKKPGIRADVMLPPGASSAVNPFGEPWPTMRGQFVEPRL